MTDKAVRSALMVARNVGRNTAGRTKAFDALAQAQRYAPESAMRHAQGDLKQFPSGAALGYALEHVGDLTHRMTANPDYNDDFGQDYVKEKIGTGLSLLRNPVDMERIKRIPDLPSLKRYAEEHAKLPVYNRAQFHAREAAVSLGKRDFSRAEQHLTALQKLIDTGMYQQSAGTYARNGEDDPDITKAEGGEVGDVPNAMNVFPKPQRMLQGDDYVPGGKYLDAATGEDVTGHKASAASIAIAPGGKPSFTASRDAVDQTGSPGKGAKQIKANLFRRKGRWDWIDAPEGHEDSAMLVSLVQHDKGKKQHYYSLAAHFPKGVDLARYPNEKDEPRLRPTTKGALEFGPQVGSIRTTNGHVHPVYQHIIAKADGGLVTTADDDEEPGIEAYHSSPHDIGPEGFRLEKIGTGEGNQTYGHGLYYAESPKVSGRGGDYWRMFFNKMKDSPERTATAALFHNKFDRDLAIKSLESQIDWHSQRAIPGKYAEGPEIEEGHRLLAEQHRQAADILRRGDIAGPRTYEVSIKGRPEHFLDWDEPVLEQPEAYVKLMSALHDQAGQSNTWNALLHEMTEDDGHLTGRHVYDRLTSPEVIGMAPPEASAFLNKAGIRGIRYLDAGSRGAGEGTRNYVVFDPQHIEIKRRYAAGGAVDEDGDEGITAYQGGPHSVGPEGYDNSKIGTGEGAAVFGHGHYFAEHEPVAKSYRDRISLLKGQFDVVDRRTGEIIPKTTPGHKSVVDFFNSYGSDLRQADIAWQKENWARWADNSGRAIAEYEDALKDPSVDQELREIYTDGLERARRQQQDSREAIGLVDRVYAKPKGHMHEVRIKGRPEHFLDWDKPLSGQSDHVRKALEGAGYKKEMGAENPLGSQIYKYLRDIYDHPKWASQELSSLGIRGIRYLDHFSRNAKEGTRNYVVFDPKHIEIKRRYADGGSVDTPITSADRYRNYRDPRAKVIGDWKWQPMREVQGKLPGLSEIPSHVRAFGSFMDEMARKAAQGGISARDLIKAYTITRSSIQRQAVDSNKVRAAGLILPPDVTGKIRPEGAFGEWLHTPAGQAYLDAAERGQAHEGAIADAVRVMAPFGKHETDIPDALRWAAANLPGREGQASELIAAGREMASKPSEWRDFTRDIRGIGPSKSGFFASLAGRGDQPTLDARQVILHTGQPTKLASPYIARKGGKGGVEAVERLAKRQRAMDLALPQELAPYYQHLAHHAVWDAAGNEETTHEDVMNAMRHAATGGAITAPLHGHPVVKALRKMGLKGLDRFADGGGVDDDPTVNKALELTRPNDLGLYSGASEAALALTQPKGSLDQMLASLKGVKPAELKWSGVREAFASPPGSNSPRTVTKEELARHFAKSLPNIRLREYNQEAQDEDYFPQYEEYTLGGGDNYREQLLRLPSRSKTMYDKAYHFRDRDAAEEFAAEARKMGHADATAEPVKHPYGDQYGRMHRVKLLVNIAGFDAEDLDRLGDRLRGEQVGSGDPLSDYIVTARRLVGRDKRGHDYASSHWEGVPNVVAHLRLKDREGPDGEKILHLEELQSDYGQDVRDAAKTYGVGTYDPDAPYQVIDRDTKQVLSRHADRSEASLDMGARAQAGKRPALVGPREAFADAPYIGTTSGWMDLGLKRLLHEAAKGGYDKIVWNPGYVHSSRYNFPVGGAQDKGMKGFYDDVMPKALAKLAKEHDPEAKFGQITMSAPYRGGASGADIMDYFGLGGDNRREYWANLTQGQRNRLFDQYHEARREDHTLPSLEITPKMRESILKKGFKAYRRGGFV